PAAPQGAPVEPAPFQQPPPPPMQPPAAPSASQGMLPNGQPPVFRPMTDDEPASSEAPADNSEG
ncbi:MAG: hypothetical protein ABW126_14385, partial [Candidatus Sedimenticola sp. 4PFRAG1]